MFGKHVIKGSSPFCSSCVTGNEIGAIMKISELKKGDIFFVDTKLGVVIKDSPLMIKFSWTVEDVQHEQIVVQNDLNFEQEVQFLMNGLIDSKQAILPQIQKKL